MKSHRFIGIGMVLLCTHAWQVNGQQIVQTIRGSVVDLETSLPLFAANVAVYQDSILCGVTISDQEGQFRIENIPVGRYEVRATYVGYRSATHTGVEVNSSREVVLLIEMEESPTEIEEIQVKAVESKGNSMNKLAFVSARTFSVEETERYAGSRGDPARMASNFAGVQGNDDSNNDLVIRGNSPLGVVWRLEGVNIPNPNHFGVSGATGGPVTMLNNKFLGLSDFMTGAFPAEFGNGVAGVFDLRMRNGNNERYEFTGQLGFIGAEFAAEGPLNKTKGSSFLAGYRYSTLSILQYFGVSVGTDAIPQYQDFNFKLNFPAGKNGNLSVFGLGGRSYIEILASEETRPDPEKVYGTQSMDEHFLTGTGVVGANYTFSPDPSSLVRVTLSGSFEHQSNHLDKVFRHVVNYITGIDYFVIDSIHYTEIGYHSNQWKSSAAVHWNKKFGSQHSLRTGVTADLYYFDMLDSMFNRSSYTYVTRLDNRSPGLLVQPYVQWKYRTSGNLDLTAGLHGQFLMLEGNHSWSLEPRLGAEYRINKKSRISGGVGLHSQMVPTYIYFSLQKDQFGNEVRPNGELDFLRSFHSVLAWDYAFNRNTRMKLEGYYQHLYNVPVDVEPSSYSMLDEGHNMERFFPDSLVNRGTGNNVGLELTAERFFSNSYFLMLTASLYDATRTGSNGTSYDAVFNGNYILNLLGTKEFSWGLKNRRTFAVGGKITFAGGKRYTPIDSLASAIAGEPVYDDNLRNSRQFVPYFRADLKLLYRINTLKLTHELGLDLVNVTARKNILKLNYLPGAEPPEQPVYQLGFLPLLYYRINF